MPTPTNINELNNKNNTTLFPLNNIGMLKTTTLKSIKIDSNKNITEKSNVNLCIKNRLFSYSKSKNVTLKVKPLPQVSDE